MSVATAGLIMAVIAGGACAAVAIVSARHRGRGGEGAPGRIAVIDLLRALMMGIALGSIALFAGRPLLDLDTFGAIHLAYLFTVVAVPLTAAVLVAARGRARDELGFTAPVKVLLVPALLLAPLGVYMTHIEPYWLSVDEVGPVTVDAARGGDEPVRIGVLTDWQLRHVGDYEVHAVDELLAAKPDIILLPGDIFQDDDEAFHRELPALRAQFNRMDVPGGAFLVDGDSDPVDRMRTMSEGTPVRFLYNEIVHTRVRDRDVTIGGSELSFALPAAVKVARDLEALPGSADIRILLTHRPDAVYNLPSHPRTDLVIAGHTHGGQIAIPGFGPLMTLSNVPRHVAAGGLFALDDRQIYVGRGVGVERNQAPQMRFFVRPNIGIVTVTG
jgi:predicted MPP superfamily phosphohydrolase